MKPIRSTAVDRLAGDLLRLWKGDAGTLAPVSHSTNSVYRFDRAGKRGYLRLTFDDRTCEQIEAELDFIHYLHAHGMRVSAPILSLQGRRIETGKIEEAVFFACVFEEAPGDRFKYDPDAPDLAHFRLRGRTLGRLHALAKQNTPPGPCRRFTWEEDKLLCNAERYIPSTEEAVRAEYFRLKEWLHGLPKDTDVFGLIHGDFGTPNYHYQGEQLTLFDFDDCCYHWFAYDVAVSVYPYGMGPDRLSVLRATLEGYNREADLSDRWVAELTGFCRLRVLYMYLVYAKKWGFTDLAEPQAQWFAQKREVMAHPVDWSL